MNAQLGLSKSISVELENNQYNVTYPNLGQSNNIEAYKMLFSKQQYGAWVRTGTQASDKALDRVDAMSHIVVLIPELMDELKEQGIKNLEDLDPIQSRRLVDVYEKVIKPWLAAWEKYLQEPVDLPKVKKAVKVGDNT